MKFDKIYNMSEADKGIIGPILGEVTQETIEAANAIAEALLVRGREGEKVKLQSPDGQEIEGTAFKSSDGTAVVVTDNFIAIDSGKGKITQFLPRKME